MYTEDRITCPIAPLWLILSIHRNLHLLVYSGHCIMGHIYITTTFWSLILATYIASIFTYIRERLRRLHMYMHLIINLHVVYFVHNQSVYTCTFVILKLKCMCVAAQKRIESNVLKCVLWLYVSFSLLIILNILDNTIHVDWRCCIVYLNSYMCTCNITFAHNCLYMYMSFMFYTLVEFNSDYSCMFDILIFLPFIWFKT